MSDIKLKAASGGGSISLKGPSSAGSDTDFLAADGTLKVTGNAAVGDSSPNVGSHSRALTISKTTAGSRTALEVIGNTANCHAAIDFKSDSTLVSAINSRGTDRLQFCTGSSGNVKAEVTGDNFKIEDGNLIVASGHGIDFSATSDATGKDNELFDDYEEGLWTPLIQSSAGSTTCTYTTQKGWYVKSGRVVHLFFDVAWNSGSGSTGGNLIVNGFPYTTSNNDDWKTQYVGPIMMTDIDVDGNAKTIAFHSWNNSTYGEFFATTDNSSWTATGYDTAGRIIGQIQPLAGA